MKTKNTLYGLVAAFFAITMIMGGTRAVNAQVYPGTYTYGSTPSYGTTYPSTGYGYNTGFIGIGSSGAQVSSLQIFLQSRGYLAMPAGVDYGYFGPLTQNALIRFQSASGLPQTGVLDSATQARMGTSGSISYPTYPTNTGNLSCPFGFTLTTYNGVFGCFMFTNSNNNFDDNNNDFLNGDNVSLRSFDLRDGDDTDVQEDDNDDELVRISFDVEDGDAELDRVKVDFEFTGNSSGEDRPWQIFDDIRLLSDGDEIDTIDGSDEDEWDKQDDDTYEITFKDLSETIRENDSADLTLEADIQNSVSDSGETTYDVFVPDDGIRILDGNNDTEDIGDDGDTVEITVNQ